jgi:prepilin-type N-terminal cleavage/methylation domain-containing protein
MSNWRRQSNQGPSCGFTLMEVVMALAVIGTMGAGAYVGFNSINTYAISSRLYTEAQACAQNQIDLVLSKGPFDIVNNKVPAVLGGQVLAANASTTVTTPNVFVYTDPVSGNVVATGTMTTKITNPGDTMAFAGATTNLNTYLATVTVTYSYRNQTYNVSMDTARTADQ